MMLGFLPMTVAAQGLDGGPVEAAVVGDQAGRLRRGPSRWLIHAVGT